MHSNGLPGGRFSRSGRSSLKRLHRLPVIALIRTCHPVHSEELFETLAHFSRELVDRFGLFLALHDRAGELLIRTRQLASEGSPTNGLHRQDQGR
jgi:hypothetical protein